jgi:uncharacterized protein YggL (DUF469 family)
MGVKAIRQELESMGIGTKSFIEKSEFVNALLGARIEINERKARCAECGEDEGVVNLKSCKSCMQVMYCNAKCQKKHWAKHKKLCKLRAAELHDEALFKDSLSKEDCPICFLPMPAQFICCVSLPPATISSVPICDFAIANEGLAKMGTEVYYPCCGKSICRGCHYSSWKSGNDEKCPFCNADCGKTDEQEVEDMMKRVAANDAASICMLGNFYQHGLRGLQQDHAKATELYVRAAELGSIKANCQLAGIYHEGGNLKKAKFHWEAAAMAGYEVARNNLGCMEAKSRNVERAIKHWTIAASAGHYIAMHELRTFFGRGFVSRESIDSTLTAYNSSCVEMRSEARDAYIKYKIETM